METSPHDDWILLRAAGIGAYVALWLAVAWGLVATTGIVKRRISKPAANAFHAFVATTGLALLALHLVLLVIDTFMPFGVSTCWSRCARRSGRSRCRPG